VWNCIKGRIKIKWRRRRDLIKNFMKKGAGGSVMPEAGSVEIDVWLEE
jgi:hypothetical protein